MMTERLLLIFPEADPGYLAECIQFSIKDEPVATPPVSRKGKAKANVPDPQRPCRIASLVGRISQKLRMPLPPPFRARHSLTRTRHSRFEPFGISSCGMEAAAADPAGEQGEACGGDG